jgi:cell division protein FtsI (penicillin-binding protein 3)
MEVATGKIKAIANLGKRSEADYWEDLNYAIRASEPGSTFKLATLLSCLEDKYVTINSPVNIEDGWRINGRTSWDSEKHHDNDVTIQQAFELSSNVGMAKTCGYVLCEKSFAIYQSFKNDLHFDQRSGVGLVGETSPVIKTPKSKTWSATSLPWMAFGYEVLVSPLQTLMLYNAVANNGRMMKPYLVTSIQKSGITIEQHEPQVLEERICSDETLRQLRVCLEGVVTAGTAKALQSPFYKFAAKTGTALVANGKHGYADHIYQSSFAGYFPAKNPKYSCIVVIKNKPHAVKYYGGAVAGPVFKEIADKLYALNAEAGSYAAMNAIRPDSNAFYYAGSLIDMKKILAVLNIRFVDSTSAKDKWSYIYSKEDRSIVNTAKVNTKIIPNVKGMGLRDALYLLENMEVKVVVNGRGKVVDQSIPAGTLLTKNQTINLALN